MSAKPSFFPRLGLPGNGPILPLHNRTSPPIRKKPSEYDMSDLSPRPDDALLSTESANGREAQYSPRRSPSPTVRYSDRASNAGSASKSRPKQRVLFAGPPPPIATSQMLYRDEEDRDASHSPPRVLEASSFARNINSVLFDRTATSPNRTRSRDYDPKPDAVWLNLQRRERALQEDLQHLLDAQSAGLAAHLDPGASPSTAPSDASDTTRSTTPTSTPHTHSPTRHHNNHNPHHNRHTNPPPTTTASGTLLPPRQPHPTKPPSLRAARANLAHTIALLADLKAAEDAHLTTALSTRKQALSQLRRWTARRDNIASELRALEEDADEPLAQELRELEQERGEVGREIDELEARLAGLRKRKRWLDGRVEEVGSRREAGLSGYRGALGEVEGRIRGVLVGPVGVRPLPVEGGFFGSSLPEGEGEDGESLGGVEFLRMRPERRTAEMAREWWEGEVKVLERRKGEVDKERVALEEGVEVWRGAVKLVSEFEAGLKREMRGGGSPGEKGRDREDESVSPSPPPSTPEQAMFAQLDKMRAVMTGLEERLHVAEENGWNLLICAIGAELEAFRQAEGMLRGALRDAGFGVGDDSAGDPGDSTPHLGRSSSLKDSSHRLDEAEPTGGGRLVDLHEGPDADREPESDNEVPPDLLGAEEERESQSDNEVPADLLGAAEGADGVVSPTLSRQDSENEVPAEFLREHSHSQGSEYHSFDGVN